MRKEFAQTLVEVAESDPRVVLLTGDLGFMVLEPFAERFRDRFFNVGVAEQNMVGIATGLAEAGYVPWVYSIATFASLRPYEFIRNGPLLHGLPVRIVGVGGGFDYGHNGVTHYALEDLGVMRIQPGLTVVAPADVDQARAAVSALNTVPGPAYLRLEKESALIPGLDGRFALGRIELIGNGEDVAIVAVGSVAAEAVAAAAQLHDAGLSPTVAIVSTLNPAPTGLAELLSSVPLAITLEAHYVTGGLGSLIAETIAESGSACRLVRHGVRAMPRGDTGGKAYLYGVHGLTAEAVARSVARELAFELR